MLLDVSEIARSLGMQYTYEVDEEPDFSDCGILLAGGVKGKIRFSNTGAVLLANGRLSTGVELECVRCLSFFRAPLAIEISEIFPLHPHEHGHHEPVETDEDDMDPGDLDIADDLYRDGIVDLTEMIRQNLLVSLPMAPLCSEDCLGLCQICGKNQNDGLCGCNVSSESPFAALKDIIDKSTN